MKRTLPILFAITAFATTAAVAEYPKIIVHEHSLAYNYPGSEYELAPHDESAMKKETTEEKMARIDALIKEADSFFPKVRVDEHSLGYNYSGSKYELVNHGDF